MKSTACDRCGASLAMPQTMAEVTLPYVPKYGDPGDYRWSEWDLCATCAFDLGKLVMMFLAEKGRMKFNSVPKVPA